MPLEHHVHAPGGAQVDMDGLQLLDTTQRNAVFTGIEGQVRQQFTPVLGATGT